MYKRKLLIWTGIMAALVIANTLVIVTGCLDKTIGGVIFIPLMLVTVYGNYRIRKKYLIKEAQNGL